MIVRLMLTGWLMTLAGCGMMFPGLQVKDALSQRKIYEWREDGGFWVEGTGTQTERFTMMQGVIVMKTDGDGNEVVDLEKSQIEYYLKADPSADSAASALGAALQASTDQMRAMGETLNKIVDSVMPLLSPVPGAGGAVPP